jgi:hypothetical protein
MVVWAGKRPSTALAENLRSAGTKPAAQRFYDCDQDRALWIARGGSPFATLSCRVTEKLDQGEKHVEEDRHRAGCNDHVRRLGAGAIVFIHACAFSDLRPGAGQSQLRMPRRGPRKRPSPLYDWTLLSYFRRLLHTVDAHILPDKNVPRPETSAAHARRADLSEGSGRCGSACQPFAYHFPVLGMDVQGSFGGNGEPFCNSSIECLSGERTKAMEPSRGGRLMVTPAFISFSQSA